MRDHYEHDVESEVEIREWTYDDAALIVRLLDGRTVEIEQHDGHGRMAIRIHDHDHMRRLGDFLLAQADKQDGQFAWSKRHGERVMDAFWAERGGKP